MRKILYVFITFVLCALFGEGMLWIPFAVAFFLLSSRKSTSSLLWEIPMGVLISSIAADAFLNEEIILLRILLPISAVLFAGFSPKKLFAFFPLAIISIFLGDGYGIAIMCGALWYGVKSVFENHRKPLPLES